MDANSTMDTIEITIETSLYEQVREFLIPYGITVEQLAEQFFRWCAEHPEEATAYLRNAMMEQGLSK